MTSTFRALPVLVALSLAGCSDDASPVTSEDTATDDTAAPIDGSNDDSATTDGTADDSATADSATTDSATTDSATTDSATTDSATTDSATADSATDGGACHTLVWGAPEVSITKVASLPAASGGTIVPGIYDATAAQTTGGVTGKYRSTWELEAGGTMKIYEALATGMSMLPTPVPRSATWSTSATTLTRTQTCGGMMSFMNDYSVRTTAEGTFLDVRSGSIQFTFKKR